MFRRQQQAQMNCRTCIKLTAKLTEFSSQKSELNSEIGLIQDELIGLKGQVGDLRIEFMSISAPVSERPKLSQFQDQSFFLSSFEETLDEPSFLPHASSSITSHAPMVRPKKFIKTFVPQPTIEEPLSPVSEEKSFTPRTPSEEEYYVDIPSGNPGCEVCTTLLKQIKREVNDIRHLKLNLVEKKEETRNYKVQFETLNRQFQMKRQYSTQMSVNSTDISSHSHTDIRHTLQTRQASFSYFSTPQSSTVPSDEDSTTISEFSSPDSDPLSEVDHLILDEFTELLEKFEENKDRVRRLQDEQSRVVHRMKELLAQKCGVVFTTYD